MHIQTLTDTIESAPLHILRARGATHSRVVVESVLPEKIQPEPMHQQIVLLDLLMLAVDGGRERTAAEFQSLLVASGFELTRMLPVERTAFSVIEASPRAGAAADAV